MLSPAIPAASFLWLFPFREPDKVLPSSKTGVLSVSTTAFSTVLSTSLSVVAAVSVFAVPVPSIIGLEPVKFMDGKPSVSSGVSSVGFFFFLAELRRKVSNCCPLKRNIRTPSYALIVWQYVGFSMSRPAIIHDFTHTMSMMEVTGLESTRISPRSEKSSNRRHTALRPMPHSFASASMELSACPGWMV